ncbi:hypothetical protein M440DRAFT_1324967, partial [Trichoderma longibrachiatum ATCC 18648]
ADWRLTVGFCATFGPNQWDPVAICKIVGPKEHRVIRRRGYKPKSYRVAAVAVYVAKLW